MACFTDQLHRTIELCSAPQRIISLVPSQTELLHALGLGERVVGITKFCVHPEEWLRTKPHVGGTKQYDFTAIRALEPDLILGNREENEQAQIELLMQEFPVWMSDIITLDDALAMIAAVGSMVDKRVEAASLSQRIAAGFAELSAEHTANGIRSMRAAYFIWRKPYMVVGHSTFISEMMRLCGLENAYAADTFSRYPEVDAESLRAAAPELLLLSSEPFPFAEKHLAEFHEMAPCAKPLLVDGEIFSWYGPRLLQAPGYFRALHASLTANAGDGMEAT
jgi:ABC-type Fe3+-hydroxamate transport system substrate-binding protein